MSTQATKNALISGPTRGRLRPGIPGLSENARVISIVGRFLEHARIYYFQNREEEESYIGSADAMARNLNNRVEVLVPIENPAMRAQLRDLIDVHLADRRSAWEMRSDGSYEQRIPESEEEECSSQEALIQLHERRLKRSTRLRRRKPRGPDWHGAHR